MNGIRPKTKKQRIAEEADREAYLNSLVAEREAYVKSLQKYKYI